MVKSNIIILRTIFISVGVAIISNIHPETKFTLRLTAYISQNF